MLRKIKNQKHTLNFIRIFFIISSERKRIAVIIACEKIPENKKQKSLPYLYDQIFLIRNLCVKLNDEETKTNTTRAKHKCQACQVFVFMLQCIWP